MWTGQSGDQWWEVESVCSSDGGSDWTCGSGLVAPGIGSKGSVFLLYVVPSLCDESDQIFSFMDHLMYHVSLMCQAIDTRPWHRLRFVIRGVRWWKRPISGAGRTSRHHEHVTEGQKHGCELLESRRMKMMKVSDTVQEHPLISSTTDNDNPQNHFHIRFTDKKKMHLHRLSFLVWRILAPPLSSQAEPVRPAVSSLLVPPVKLQRLNPVLLLETSHRLPSAQIPYHVTRHLLSPRPRTHSLL